MGGTSSSWRRGAAWLGLAAALCLAAEARAVQLALDNAELIELVKWASQVTDKSIIVHPSVSGRVTVLAGADMSMAEAYQVFLAVLQVHGFTVVEGETAVRILPGERARTSALPVVGDGAALPPQDMAVQVIRVENVAASRLLGLLQPMVSQAGYVAAYQDTNMLLLADRTANIKKLLQVIEHVDQVGLVDIELVRVEHANARDLAATINALIPDLGDSGSPFRLAVDDRTNSLLLTGDPFTRQQVGELLRELDQPLASDSYTQVVRVEYIDTAELLPVLQSVASSLQRRTRDQDPGSEIILETVQELNTIIISAPPAITATLKAVVADLDVPRAQVLVEALIVEVNQEAGRGLGIEWLSSIDASGSDTVGGFSFFPSGILPLSIADGGFTLGSGLSIGHIRGGELRALFNALATSTEANILSTPTVLTLDNEQASILVGSNVPFITGSESQDSGNPFTTVQRQDIGIALNVRPRINNDNSVTLDIEQTVEDISSTANAVASDIITNKREIRTRVLVENGRTLVLGGLIRDEVREIERGVPFLRRIPLIGRLFRSKDLTTVKRNLMVFIRPQILTTRKATDAATGERLASIKAQQDAFARNRKRFGVLGKPFPKIPDKFNLVSGEGASEEDTSDGKPTEPGTAAGGDDSDAPVAAMESEDANQTQDAASMEASEAGNGPEAH